MNQIIDGATQGLTTCEIFWTYLDNFLFCVLNDPGGVLSSYFEHIDGNIAVFIH